VGEDTSTVAKRESLVLADMMAACLPGEDKRPSVEALLHDLLPWPLIVHLHPTLVNGLTCGIRGPEIAREIFGDSQEWIPICDPGYVLAKNIKLTLEARSNRGMEAPEYIFLANHGIFVGGSDSDEIREKYSRLQEALEARLIRKPGTMPVSASLPGDSEALKLIASKLFGENAELVYVTGGELDRYLTDEKTAAPLTGSLTPDHIVYSGPGVLYLRSENPIEEWENAAESYIGQWGKPPNITLINDNSGTQGALVAAAGMKSLTNAVLMLESDLEVCVYAESFGGPLIMEEPFVKFIVNWEVENYRNKVVS
ncbi:MAG: class II aldolase/adducin family protein, partial [Spirochaetaceae bacterium]|nr:class II aldolase/adducin family protein [Spirochaetaceae bacterium]